jgi:hypothetical protein
VFIPRWLIVGVVPLEIVMGIWLISGTRTQVARRLTINIFVLFLFFSLVSAMRGEKCQCFGTLGRGLNSWASVLMDLLCIAALTCTDVRNSGLDLPHQTPIACKTACAVIFAAALVLNAPHELSQVHRGSKVFKADQWAGKQCPLFEQVKIDRELQWGRWSVLLVQSGCLQCQRAITEFVADVPTSPLTRRAIIFTQGITPEDAHRLQVEWQGCAIGTLTSDDWVIESPSQVELEDGRVIVTR